MSTEHDENAVQQQQHTRSRWHTSCSRLFQRRICSSRITSNRISRFGGDVTERKGSTSAKMQRYALFARRMCASTKTRVSGFQGHTHTGGQRRHQAQSITASQMHTYTHTGTDRELEERACACRLCFATNTPQHSTHVVSLLLVFSAQPGPLRAAPGPRDPHTYP